MHVNYTTVFIISVADDENNIINEFINFNFNFNFNDCEIG